MHEQDRLSSLILRHWRNHCPTMLSQLEGENRLDQALAETTERMADLLYELVSVRKMQYHQAWELAMDQFLLTEDSA